VLEWRQELEVLELHLAKFQEQMELKELEELEWRRELEVLDQAGELKELEELEWRREL